MKTNLKVGFSNKPSFRECFYEARDYVCQKHDPFDVVIFSGNEGSGYCFFVLRPGFQGLPETVLMLPGFGLELNSKLTREGFATYRVGVEDRHKVHDAFYSQIPKLDSVKVTS